MKNYFLKVLVSVSMLALLIASCAGPKERKAESILDTPEYHYNEGVKFLKADDINNAAREFNLAKSLKADFAPAYEGLGLVSLEQGDLETAEKLIKESLNKDGDWIPAQVAKGRLYIAREEYEDAIDEFEDAVEDVDDSKSVKDKRGVKKDAYYWMGVAYKQWGKYIEAQTAFQQILEIDNTDTRASKAIKELAEYQAAVAGQSPELRKIAAQKEITRADVAVLFVTELPIEKIFRKSPSQQKISYAAPGQSIMGQRQTESGQPEWAATDVSDDFWAKTFVDKALKMGIIDKYPDDTFKPNEKVNRAEFARLIEHFLVKAWDDSELETQYFGSVSPFADVLNTSPIFNSIMVVSTRGIMPGFEDGTFKPLKVVSGAEALNIIRNLKSKF
jgi:tetratricopeptide (TPR) repeat protein